MLEIMIFMSSNLKQISILLTAHIVPLLIETQRVINSSVSQDQALRHTVINSFVSQD